MQTKVIHGALVLLLILGLSACKALREMPSKSRDQEPHFEHEALEKDKKPSSENHSRAEKSTEISKSNGALEAFIEDWYGTPHRMGGMTKKGVDCSGFVIIAYQEVFKLRFKGRRAEDIFSEMKPVKRANLKYGDLVFFKVGGRRIDHVGIYLQDGDFAHTSSSRGVMISNLSNTYWTKRFFKGGRYQP